MHTFYFAMLRYILKPTTQEFVNIGVVLYCSDLAFLKIKVNMKAFNKDILEAITAQVNNLKITDAESLETILDRVMPQDDGSALAFSKVGYGVTNNIEQELDTLYTALVFDKFAGCVL